MTTSIGMVKCLNIGCESNKAYNVLAKYKLTYTTKEGYEKVWNPETEGYSILKNKYNPRSKEGWKKFKLFIENVSNYYHKWLAQNAYRMEFGNIGYLVELSDSKSNVKLFAEDNRRSQDIKLCCPYCKSEEVIYNIKRKPKAEYYINEDPCEGKVTVKQRHPITKEWINVQVDVTPNPQCDYKMEVESPIAERIQAKEDSYVSEAEHMGIYSDKYIISNLNPYIADLMSREFHMTNHIYNGEMAYENRVYLS